VAFSQENVGGVVKGEIPLNTIPQSALLPAPFTQGSLSHKKISALIFYLHFLSAIASFEPRDYRVVFF